MQTCIRASRVIATLVLAFLIWNESATNSLIGSLDAEAASEPTRTARVSSRGATREPTRFAPDLLISQALPQPPRAPTAIPDATPEPLGSPTATPQTADLGIFKVTGYSDSMLNGTDGRGITRSGERTRWGVVAVDPRVLPLGSRLMIEGMEDTVFTALDTGGGIIGRWVDVWFASDSEALRHGVKHLRIHLLLD